MLAFAIKPESPKFPAAISKTPDIFGQLATMDAKRTPKINA